MEKERIKQFTKAFFKKLDCTIEESQDFLKINNVPEKFEKFSGKKGPYTLAFSKTSNQEAELIAPGSYLLKAMSEFLENKGETTLIKLNFDRDYKKEFEHFLKLRNCQIQSVIQTPDYHTISRFTFQTNLQYLNENEKILNSIYVQNGNVIDFNPEKYKQEPGKKKDISKKDFKPDYESAKNHLKSLLSKRVSQTSESLKERLERESDRIKNHYKQQAKETFNLIEKGEKNIQKLNVELNNKPEERPTILAKIERIENQISNLKNSGNLKKMQDEEDFFLKDEKSKHSLNISNKLINTTIIYYPVYIFNIILKNKKATKKLEVIYHPIKDTITPISCQICELDTKEIFLCSSGHVACNNCIESCKSCNLSLCSLCKKQTCEECNRKLCTNCISKCASCNKVSCISHMREDYISKKLSCLSCLKHCSFCNQFTRKSRFRIDPQTSRESCEKCIRLRALKPRI